MCRKKAELLKYLRERCAFRVRRTTRHDVHTKFVCAARDYQLTTRDDDDDRRGDVRPCPAYTKYKLLAYIYIYMYKMYSSLIIINKTDVFNTGNFSTIKTRDRIHPPVTKKKIKHSAPVCDNSFVK